MKLKEKMKNKNHNKFDKKKLIGTISKKHIKNGSYTMVMSVIFIAVVIVIINYLISISTNNNKTVSRKIIAGIL